MAFEAGHALVIGIGSYHHMPKMNVPLTVEDALEIAAVLEDRRYCGYPAQQVTLLQEEKATRQAIEAEFDRLAKTLKERDTFLLFYSGHGEYGADGYYLTTHDTRMTDKKVIAGSGIHEKVLLEKINAIRAKRVFLIFNACHSGEISPDSLGDGIEHLPSQSLPGRTSTALLGTGEGRVIITACRENQRSYFLKTQSLTFFAQALADGLRGRDIANRRGYISLFDLYEYVFTNVSAEVKRRYGVIDSDIIQEPELTIQKGIGAMAIALHRGKTPAGELNEQAPPQNLGNSVREIEPEQSQKALQQILNGEFTVGRNINVVGRDQINLRRSQGAIINPVSGTTTIQHFGNITNVDTFGGDYAAQNLYKQSFVLNSSNMATPLKSICKQVSQMLKKAQQQGQTELFENLRPIEVLLQAAEREETQEREEHRTTMLIQAKQLLRKQLDDHPELHRLFISLQQLE